MKLDQFFRFPSFLINQLSTFFSSGSERIYRIFRSDKSQNIPSEIQEKWDETTQVSKQVFERNEKESRITIFKKITNFLYPRNIKVNTLIELESINQTTGEDFDLKILKVLRTTVEELGKKIFLDLLRDEMSILGMDMPGNLSGPRLFSTKASSPVQIFDRCVTEIFKKFSREIEQMQRLGISKKIITEAILDGRFSLLLFMCLNKTNLQLFYRYLFAGVMISKTHFSYDLHDKTIIPAIVSYCKFEFHSKIKKAAIGLPNQKNELHPIRDFEKIYKYVISNSIMCIDDSTIRIADDLLPILELAFSQIHFLHSGIEFNCNYVPSSELNIDDIKQIHFSARYEKAVLITITLVDGRFLRRFEGIADAYYIKKIPEIQEKISCKTKFSYPAFACRVRRPWTANHIVEMLRTSLFECPFTFEGIIGSKVKQLEEDIKLLNPLNIQYYGCHDVSPKIINNWFRTKSHEDYVNFMLHSFKKYLPEFTKAGFEMGEIRKATADGNFLLLLRVCRTGLSKSDMRNLYEKTSIDQEAKKEFIQTCENELNELKEHKKDMACFPVEQALQVQSGVIHWDSRKVVHGFKNIYGFKDISDELGIYLAKKNQLHLLSDYAKDNPEMFQNLQPVAVLAHQGRLKEEDVDKIWKDPSSDEAKKIVARAKDLIQEDLLEWESIFQSMEANEQVILVYQGNKGQDERNAYMKWIINQGRWSEERKLFVRAGPSVKSARNLGNQ